MDILKSAVWAAIALGVAAPLSNAAASPAQPSTPTGQVTDERTAALVAEYRSRRPGALQAHPTPARRPDGEQSRLGPPAPAAPTASGMPAITLPAGGRRQTSERESGI